MSYKILLADNVDERCEKVFTARGMKAVKKTSMTDDDLYKEIEEYDGIVVA